MLVRRGLNEDSESKYYILLIVMGKMLIPFVKVRYKPRVKNFAHQVNMF